MRPASTTSRGAEVQADWRFVRAHPAHFLAFGLGSGLAPKAPGTAGTLVALPLYFLLAPLGGWYWLAVALALLIGIWACDVAGRALGVHDHGGIVWDEIAAFLLVLPFAPQTLVGFVLAFALFRLFDIWKPFPIRWFDRQVPGGLGVMLDDLLAAGYAILCLMGIAPWL
nr:phosphatidylglycerophosphatase A [Sulfuritortus calidifontis]